MQRYIASRIIQLDVGFEHDWLTKHHQLWKRDVVDKWFTPPPVGPMAISHTYTAAMQRPNTTNRTWWVVASHPRFKARQLGHHPKSAWLKTRNHLETTNKSIINHSKSYCWFLSPIPNKPTSIKATFKPPSDGYCVLNKLFIGWLGAAESQPEHVGHQPPWGCLNLRSTWWGVCEADPLIVSHRALPLGFQLAVKGEAAAKSWLIIVSTADSKGSWATISNNGWL